MDCIKRRLLSVLIALMLFLLALPSVASTYLVDKQGNQNLPVVAGDVVVWEDCSGDNCSIYLHSFSAGETKMISSSKGYQYAPDTDGNYVVWVDRERDRESIVLYEIATEKLTDIIQLNSERRNPKVDYPWVCWSDNRGSKWEVYAYNIESGKAKLVADHHYSASKPENLGLTLDGEQLVWTDHRNLNWDLYGINLKQGKEFPVVVADGNQLSPDLEGKHLVYQDDGDLRWKIRHRALDSGQDKLIGSSTRDQKHPRISGNVVVWQDFREQRWDIYGFDLSKNKEFVISNKQRNQTHPSISGKRIIFMDDRNLRQDLSIVVLGEEELADSTGSNEQPGIKLIVNGQPLVTDVAPVLKDGRVLIPVRAVGVALGVDVDWDAQQQRVVFLTKESSVELEIGKVHALVNDNPKELDVPAEIIAGRTMVPVRFVSQAFGAKVNWEADLQLVEVSL